MYVMDDQLIPIAFGCTGLLDGACITRTQGGIFIISIDRSCSDCYLRLVSRGLGIEFGIEKAILLISGNIW